MFFFVGTDCKSALSTVEHIRALGFCSRSHEYFCVDYKLFYKEGEFKKFYSDITNSEKIIEKAHEIRNQNPITHASAKMLEKDSSNQEIIETIEDLKNLIYEFCKIKKLC